MIAIRARQIYTPLDIISPGLLIVEKDKIVEVTRDTGQSMEGIEVIEAPKGILAPGMIDVHTHGIGGMQTIDGNPQDLNDMSEHYARHGVTSFLATVGGSQECIEGGIRAALESSAQGAEILGIHMEGPFISPHRPGAFPPETIVPPDAALFKRYLDLCEGRMCMVTLAPEEEGALEIVRIARQAGVICSAGHTQATYEQMMEAIEAGVTHITHTFNAMPALNHRTPGVLGAVLTDNRLTAEVITDGIHVHPAVVKLLVRTKGPGRVVAVSDSIGAAGLPDGTYHFEELDITVANKSARLADGTLAGSVMTLEEGLPNLVKFCGISLSDALRITSLNTALEQGVADRKGSLAPGMDADLICLDQSLSLNWTMARGRIFKPARKTGRSSKA